MPKGSVCVADIVSEPTFIYGLADPKTMRVRYVGKTTNLKKRLSIHLTDLRARRIYHWISELRITGDLPRMLVLLRVEPGEDAASAEREMIGLYSRFGLFNVVGVAARNTVLAAWIADNGLSQTGFADRLRETDPTLTVLQSEVSRWLRGKREPNAREKAAICDLTGISPHDLHNRIAAA